MFFDEFYSAIYFLWLPPTSPDKEFQGICLKYEEPRIMTKVWFKFAVYYQGYPYFKRFFFSCFCMVYLLGRWENIKINGKRKHLNLIKIWYKQLHWNLTPPFSELMCQFKRKSVTIASLIPCTKASSCFNSNIYIDINSRTRWFNKLNKGIHVNKVQFAQALKNILENLPSPWKLEIQISLNSYQPSLNFVGKFWNIWD